MTVNILSEAFANLIVGVMMAAVAILSTYLTVKLIKKDSK